VTKQNENGRAAEFEARIEKLEAELASLRPAPKQEPKPYIEEGTRVTLHQPAFVQPDDFPTQSELDGLLRIVLASYPKLGPAGDPDKYKSSFRMSFLSLCHIRRRDGIDKLHHMSFWRDLGQDTLASLNVSARLELAPFVAAVIAHGDIDYTHPNHEQNFSMSAGLIFGGVGRAYNGVWKKVFEAGRVNAPVEISIPRNVMSQNVVITGGGRGVGQRW
jgi:hypothetical protein